MEKGLKNKFNNLIYLIPAFLFIASILLIRLHFFSMPLSNIYWSDATDSTELTDMFSFWKAMMVICAGFLATISLVVAYFRDKVRFNTNRVLLPVLIYSVAVVLSFAFSDYKYFALRGMHEHFEGTAILLIYMFMLIFLLFSVNNEYRVKSIVVFVMAVVVLLALLGITQAYGHDFLTTATGQKVMAPNYTLDSGIKLWDMIDMLASQGDRVFTFSFTQGEVYQTVYNINYVPFYLTLIIPLCAALFIHYTINGSMNGRVAAIVFLIVYALALYNFFAANSASGYFGLTAIFITAIIIFHKELKKWIKPLICLILVAGLVMGMLADRWLPEIKELVGGAMQSVTDFIYADDELPSVEDFKNAPADTWIPIDTIETTSTQVSFGINGSKILIARDDAQSAFTITDENGEQLYMTTIEGVDGTFQILDERFHDYVTLSLIRAEDGTVIDVTTKGTEWYFLYDGEKFQYANSVGKYVDLTPIPHSSLIKNYAFGSYRGRIWATTIPMLKHYMLVGAGADCFPFVFPQNDYVTLYNMFEGQQMNLVTDKAHNLYMQYWVNTGFLSLVAWLAMVGLYLVGAVKYFRKRGFVDFCDFVNGGIFCGIIGFLATAFFNDGSVNTMPMFYTMLGLGFAINARDQWGEPEQKVSKRQAQMPEI